MNLLQLNLRHQSPPQKGEKGKNLICIFIVCIEKQTKGSQDEAVKNIEKYALLSQSYFLVNHGLN